MTEVRLSYNPEEEGCSEEQWLIDLALRKNYKYVLFEISHNMWRKWKHDDEQLNVDTLREEISRILYDNGITYEILEQ